MAAKVYENIRRTYRSGVVDGKQVYISPHQHWLIGSYHDLHLIAPKLRHQPDLLSQLHVPEGIRFGLRMTDTFSTLSRLRSFKRHIKGKSPEFSPEYLLRRHQEVRRAEHNGKIRLTDLYQLAKTWYERASWRYITLWKKTC